MIISFIAEKGGTGKTTLASNIAAMRSKKKVTLLIDTDPQKNSFDWSNIREPSLNKGNLITDTLYGEIDSEVKKIKDNFDDIIIDAGGRDSDEMRSALLVSDIVIIPLLPSILDLWTIELMETLYFKVLKEKPNLKAKIVLNKCPTNYYDKNETFKIIKLIQKSTKLDLSKNLLYERKTYRKSMEKGLGVADHIKSKRDNKAYNEICSLYKEIFKTKY